MSHKSQTNSYTEFFYKSFRNILIVSVPLVIISALALSLPHSSATDSGNTSSSDNFTVSISDACTLSSVVESAHTANVNAGTYTSDIGITKISTFCNDMNGYSIYAVGASNGTVGNTDLISSINDNYNIHTGIYDSSSIGPNTPSSWSMKLTAGTGTGNVLTPPTIVNGYNNYSAIPNVYTQVAKRQSATDMNLNTDITGSYFTTTYDIYVSSIQTSGTYSGAVKYLMVHPSANAQTLSMQDVANWKNGALPNEGDSIQAIDQRDGKKYWVTKLADGHIWMTQNLDLDLVSDTTAENYVALTSENTDLNLYGSMGYDSNNGYSCSNPNTTTNCTANGEVITWVPERSTIPEDSLNSTTWKNDNNNPYSYDRGIYAPNGVMDGHGYTGNYYNWAAAIASNNLSSYSVDNTVAASSICPRGWRLPNAASMTGGYEFSKLLYAYGITTDDKNTAGYASSASEGLAKTTSSPLYFVRSGSINGGNIYFSEKGRYRSGAGPSSNPIGLDFDSNNISPALQHVGYLGLSIRCLAE